MTGWLKSLQRFPKKSRTKLPQGDEDHMSMLSGKKTRTSIKRLEMMPTASSTARSEMAEQAEKKARTLS